ncbi:hypothetical protein C4D60_Mb05t26960 [Musa balbisiana]|uniref:non-specific serine/threonine protein kinase n=1 Tax=Musa balbisiana TaxID=52838 RepID=A0A4S8JZ44_MUSBA|nr:hypothetical protein C4D60_Mb05t26960 [Musa balbisiana]
MPTSGKRSQTLHAFSFFVIFVVPYTPFLHASYTVEMEKLLTLRDSLSQGRNLLSNWFNVESPCNWSGITCVGPAVQAIDLSYTPLNSSIPSCMGEFRHLKALNLSGCAFSGQVPDSFGDLQTLQSLDLSRNQLSGALPSSLANLKMLKELVLDANSFSGGLRIIVEHLKGLTKLSISGNSFSGSIPLDIGSLQNLEYLDLSMNYLSGTLPSSLENLSRLLHLDVSRNRLSGSIFPGIGSLGDLLTLDLSSNSFIGSLPSAIGRLTSLDSLWLGRNGFTGSLPVEIGKMKQLKIFSLHSCKLTGTVPREISELRNLIDLDISENNFEGELPRSIGNLVNLMYLVAADAGLSGHLPEQLGSCKNLKILDLSFNSFSGPLPASLAGLESITTFIVEGNHLEGPIPPWISNWKMVNSIRLGKNQFSGSLPPLDLPFLTSFSADANQLSGEITSKICDCRSLSSLSLSENKLTGSIEETFRACSNLTDLILLGNNLHGEIPDYLGELPLVTLELSQNNFSGHVPDQLWRSPTILEISLSNNLLAGCIRIAVGNISNLERLQLDYNFFEGSIPKSIGKLRNLTNLSLHGNRLSGEIPPELFNCTNLVALDLGSNNLTGSIPEAISRLNLLDDLVLSNNQLSGHIPGEICAGFQRAAYPDSEFTQHYGVLDLSYNNLTGQIPAAIKNCAVLKELRLQGNMLSGSIPPELAELTNLTLLDFSFNSLSGPILVQVSPLQSLQGLLLSNNQLGGLIPSELSLMLPSLVKLNLSSNRLTGAIPETVFDIKTLTYVDISSNSVSGSIPFGGSIARGISSLLIFNASNNYLSGTMSESVSNLTSLAVLDLHNNSLTGSLPSSLSKLDYLTYLDLSNNGFLGDIPCDVCSIVGLSFVNFSGNKLYRYAPEECASANRCVAQLVPYPPPTRSPTGGLIWGVGLGAAVGLLALVFLLLKWKAMRQQSLDLVSTDKANLAAVEPASSDELLGKKMKEPLSINIATFQHALLRLTPSDIMKATENFSKARIIGDGGFGTVYRAVLPEECVVAIKRLHGGGQFQGDREFLAEMETIGKVKHRNLVPLLGYCVFGDERFLIYEYMENGSLEVWLRNRADAVDALSWPVRLKICLGSARGLAFLHHGFVPHIIHRDMKSSNILLDKDFEPRVSDFGLARIISACETHVSTDLAGTFGYIPPEYGLTMRATAKGDVYSFGVVTLELLTGWPPTGQEEVEGGGNLVGWVRWMVGRGKEAEVFDPCLPRAGGGPSREQMLRVLEVARACTADEPWKRPTMLEVVKMLNEIKMEACS